MTAAVTPGVTTPGGRGRSGRLDVVVGRALGTVLLTLRGHVRPSTRDRLCTHVDQVLEESPERLVIDLTDATIDADAVHVLAEVRSTAEDHQVQLVLTSRNPAHRPAIEAAERR
jgi:anti-anti-sigma regulatory factor